MKIETLARHLLHPLLAAAILVSAGSVFAGKEVYGPIESKDSRPIPGNSPELDEEKSAAAKSFFCKATISTIGDPAPSSLSGPLVLDLGTVGSCSQGQYSTNFSAGCQTPANSACSAKALADSNFNSAAFWCGKGVPNGSTIRAYAAVGQPQTPSSIAKGKYISAHTRGVLINMKGGCKWQ